MPNVASLLKAEIVRLARKEVRNEVGSLRKASASQRRQIASLKREITTLQRQAKGLARQASGSAKAKPVAACQRSGARRMIVSAIASAWSRMKSVCLRQSQSGWMVSRRLQAV